MAEKTSPLVSGTSIGPDTPDAKYYSRDVFYDDAVAADGTTPRNPVPAMGLVAADPGSPYKLLGRLKGIADAVAAMATAVVNAINGSAYTLADGTVTLNAGQATAWFTIAKGGAYTHDAAFTGSSPNLTFERLGADGATPIAYENRTAPGGGTTPLIIPGTAQIRAKNTGAGSLTNVGIKVA